MDADETHLWRQPNATAPTAFLRAAAVNRAVAVVALLFYSIFFALVLKRLRELRGASKHVKRSEAASATLVRWVGAHVGCCWLAQVLNNVVFSVPFASQSLVPVCIAYQKAVTVLYLGAMSAQLMVLLKRAGMTLDKSKTWTRLAYQGTALMTMTGMPAVILLALVTFKGAIFYRLACSQELVLFVVWIFVVAGTGLNVCFLLLFIIPVWQHMRNTINSADASQARATKKLQRTARKNLRLSVVQIASTLAFQLLGALFQTLLRDDEGHPERSFLRQYQYAGYVVDLMVNSSALLLMTKAWQPLRLRQWRRRNNKVTYATDNGAESTAVSASVASDTSLQEA